MKVREKVSRFAGSSLRAIPLATLAFGGMFTLTSQASADTAKTCPPLTQGYWKNHTSVWAKQTLMIGTASDKQSTAEQILQTPVSGDASVDLAHQLIAALLNIMVIGTDSTPIAKTIADAEKLLGSGSVPEGIDPSSAVGQQMEADAAILDNFNNGLITTACGTPVVTGSCQPSSSLSVLVSGTNVTSYIPKGRWGSGPIGVSVVNVEGTSITPTLIATPGTVNSCASNALTGETVCTENSNNVDFFSGTSKTLTATSGGTGTIFFSGGSCTNCGVAMDASHDQAVIGLSLAGTGGFQFIDLSTATPTFGTPFASQAPATGFAGATKISEDVLIDPIRNLALSPNESGNYELVNVATPSTPASFENSAVPGAFLDSAGEDCSTGIALAGAEGSAPSRIFLADLTQATFTAGSPAGTWTDTASQVQTLSESNLSAGASGLAVAQGTHTGVVSGEFGGNQITAIALPTTSGSGTPAITDWVSCGISGFSAGFDPHTVTAYQSPNTSDAIALLANGGATQLTVVDLTKMLNTTTVPRDVAGHACASGTLPATVVSFITVP
jgi:hypothetical protein